MFEYKVFIPKERKKMLTKDEDKKKKLLEKKLKVKLEITNDEVIIKSKDSYTGWVCEKILKAIGRGFNAEQAFRLLDDNYALEVIDISDYAKTKKSMVRLKGRVIGENGRAKRHLERVTGCSMCVYGKTISLICKEDASGIARNAVQMILEGAKHSTAYRYIDKTLKKMPEF